MIQVNPSYEKVSTIEDLTKSQKLHPTVADIFRTEKGETLTLYRHQVDAISKAHENRSYVVTSGTGSGKSLAYLIPIFDAILKTKPSDPKVPSYYCLSDECPGKFPIRGSFTICRSL